MTRLFKEPRALVRQGPLGPSIDVFAERLKEQGYGKHTIGSLTRLVADFCCWINLRRIDVPGLAQEQVERYLKYRKRQRYPRPEDQTTLMRFLGLLVQQGLVEEIAAPTEIPAVQVLQEHYQRYLQQERRLAAATIVHYIDVTGRFLRRLYGSGQVRLGSLRPADIIDFVQGEAARVRAGRARFVTTALRSFLRYARYRDLIKTDLQGSVPTVANWSMAGIPKKRYRLRRCKVCSPSATNEVLWLRDYAMLAVDFHDFGLRASEVVRDLTSRSPRCWTRSASFASAAPRQASRTACRSLRMSELPWQTTASRAPPHLLLMTCLHPISCAPTRTAWAQGTVSCIVFAAPCAARWNPIRHQGGSASSAPFTRHTDARGGVVARGDRRGLRHRNPQTTTIYAKVDLVSLHALALPWPGGVR